MFSLFTEPQLQSKDIDILKHWLTTRLSGYTIAIKDMTAGNTIWRGVPYSERPSFVKDLSYPPVESIKKDGRVNRCGRPMFYASGAFAAVFYELHLHPGDYVAMARWEVTEALSMHPLGYHASSLSGIGANPCHLSSRAGLVNPIPSETKKNERLRKTLAHAFTSEVQSGQEYRYKQSIALAELLMERQWPEYYPDGAIKGLIKTAGIAYPAMQLKGDADNIVLLPEFADSSLAIRDARYIRVEAINPVTMACTVLVVATANQFPDGKISWKIPTAREEYNRFHIANERGRWVMRNGMGQICDYH